MQKPLQYAYCYIALDLCDDTNIYLKIQSDVDFQVTSHLVHFLLGHLGWLKCARGLSGTCPSGRDAAWSALIIIFLPYGHLVYVDQKFEAVVVSLAKDLLSALKLDSLATLAVVGQAVVVIDVSSVRVEDLSASRQTEVLLILRLRQRSQDRFWTTIRLEATVDDCRQDINAECVQDEQTFAY